jgi:hypothetical protein
MSTYPTVTKNDVLEGVRRVLEITKGEKFPRGDMRISTYLSKGMGRYSRTAIYHHFRGWPELMATVFGLPKAKRISHAAVPKRHYTKTKRTCLGCDRVFMSWGPENRKCERCRQSKAYLEGDDDMPYPVFLPTEWLSL